MNFIVKEYDPVEDALQRLIKFNGTPKERRELSEKQLIGLLVKRIKADERTRKSVK